MKIFLYIFLILIVGISAFILPNVVAQAQPSVVSSGSISIDPPTTHKTFEAFVQAIVKFVFYIAMAIAPIMIIVAGFLFLTSAGDPKKIETAKAVLMYTLIGLAICLMATGIIKLINQVLGV